MTVIEPRNFCHARCVQGGSDVGSHIPSMLRDTGSWRRTTAASAQNHAEKRGLLVARLRLQVNDTPALRQSRGAHPTRAPWGFNLPFRVGLLPQLYSRGR